MYFNKLLYIIIRTMGWFCAALSKDSGSWSEEEEEKRESLFFREVNHLLKPIAYHRSSYSWLQQAKNIKNVEFQKEPTNLAQLFAKSRPNVPPKVQL